MTRQEFNIRWLQLSVTMILRELVVIYGTTFLMLLMSRLLGMQLGLVLRVVVSFAREIFMVGGIAVGMLVLRRFQYRVNMLRYEANMRK